jgi:hypothetical protein
MVELWAELQVQQYCMKRQRKHLYPDWHPSPDRIIIPKERRDFLFFQWGNLISIKQAT